MTRTNAREIVVHLLYDMGCTRDSVEEAVELRFEQDYYATLAEENEVYADRPDQKQRQYIESALRGIEARREELDGYIARYAIGWSLQRIPRLVRAILELAIYEILYVDDVPTSAAINEAVELARRYEDEDIVSFVNGILGSFAREAEK